jgi:hypothetical protein
MEELIYGFNRFNGYSHIIPYIEISVDTCETGETCNFMNKEETIKYDKS